MKDLKLYNHSQLLIHQQVEEKQLKYQQQP